MKYSHVLARIRGVVLWVDEVYINSDARYSWSAVVRNCSVKCGRKELTPAGFQDGTYRRAKFYCPDVTNTENIFWAL